MDDDMDNPLPPWTPVSGGCEGMLPMTATNTDEALSGNKTNHEQEGGVPVREAYRQLFEYVVSDDRFPTGTERSLPATTSTVDDQADPLV